MGTVLGHGLFYDISFVGIMKTLFPIALGSGRSEIHAVFKDKDILKFKDHILWVKINPNPSFISET